MFSSFSRNFLVALRVQQPFSLTNPVVLHDRVILASADASGRIVPGVDWPVAVIEPAKSRFRVLRSLRVECGGGGDVLDQPATSGSAQPVSRARLAPSPSPHGPRSPPVCSGGSGGPRRGRSISALRIALASSQVAESALLAQLGTAASGHNVILGRGVPILPGRLLSHAWVLSSSSDRSSIHTASMTITGMHPGISSRRICKGLWEDVIRPAYASWLAADTIAAVAADLVTAARLRGDASQLSSDAVFSTVVQESMRSSSAANATAVVEHLLRERLVTEADFVTAWGGQCEPWAASALTSAHEVLGCTTD